MAAFVDYTERRSEFWGYGSKMGLVKGIQTFRSLSTASCSSSNSFNVPIVNIISLKRYPNGIICYMKSQLLSSSSDKTSFYNLTSLPFERKNNSAIINIPNNNRHWIIPFESQKESFLISGGGTIKHICTCEACGIGSSGKGNCSYFTSPTPGGSRGGCEPDKNCDGACSQKDYYTNQFGQIIEIRGGSILVEAQQVIKSPNLFKY